MKSKRRKAKPPSQQRKITEVVKKITRKKQIRLILFLFVLSCIALYFIVGDRGTYKLFTFYNQKEKLTTEIEKLENENKELEDIQSKLENDPQYIEKVAREKYKMKKKGERVYQVVEK